MGNRVLIDEFDVPLGGVIRDLPKWRCADGGRRRIQVIDVSIEAPSPTIGMNSGRELTRTPYVAPNAQIARVWCDYGDVTVAPATQQTSAQQNS